MIGGLGSAVAEYISGISLSPPLLKIGIEDSYGDAGDYQTLLNKKKLMPHQIFELILAKFHSI